MKRKTESTSHRVRCWGHCCSPYCMDAASFWVDIWLKRDLPTGRVESARSSSTVISHKGEQKRAIVSTGHMSQEVPIGNWRRQPTGQMWDEWEEEAEMSDDLCLLWDRAQSWLPILRFHFPWGPLCFVPSPWSHISLLTILHQILPPYQTWFTWASVSGLSLLYNWRSHDYKTVRDKLCLLTSQCCWHPTTICFYFC